MAVLLAALLALAVPTPPLGRVLLVPAALALGTVSLRDLLMVPTLLVCAEGITVVVGFRRRAWRWDQVSARVVTDRRSPLLELDVGDTVIVLSRRRLGRAPDLVLEQLDSARP